MLALLRPSLLVAALAGACSAAQPAVDARPADAAAPPGLADARRDALLPEDRAAPQDAPRAPAARRRPVIITSDCGTEIDDQWAIIYAAVSGRLELLGLVSTHAPNLPQPAAQHTARVMRELLADVLQLPAPPPVHEGASSPLAAGQPRDNSGVQLILQQARQRPAGERLTIVSLGAMTDITSAMLLDPSIAERLDVQLMGFKSWPAGGDSWNVKNDLEAARVVLGSAASITVACEDVARQHLGITRQSAAALLAGRGGSVGAWLAQATEYFFTLYAAQTHDGWTIWDFSILAAMFGMAQQTTYARPTLQDDLSFAPGPAGGPRLSWVTAVDGPGVFADFVARLDAAY